MVDYLARVRTDNDGNEDGRDCNDATRGHVGDRQYWIYSDAGNQVTFHLAHPRGALAGLPGYANAHPKAKEANRFFFKHVLLKSKKTTSQQDKAWRRQVRREHHESREKGGLSMYQKFGEEVKGEQDNTVIDLADISAVTALQAIRDAIVAFAGWNPKGHGIVTIHFPHPCVRNADAFHVRGQEMTVAVVKINDTNYDIYHRER